MMQSIVDRLPTRTLVLVLTIIILILPELSISPLLIDNKTVSTRSTSVNRKYDWWNNTDYRNADK